MNDMVYDLMILGSGPAGLTAGLYAHRAGLNVLILGGDSPGGKVMTHPLLENYPPFPGGVTGAELMIRWVKQVSDEIGDGPVAEMVTDLNLAGETKTATTDSGVYRARTAIIATGAAPRRLGIPGEADFEGKGVFSCAMCDAPLLRTLARSRALVVGGGDTALHTALGLLPHAESVVLITRGDALRAQPVLIDRFEQNEKSSTVFNRKVTAIQGESWVTCAEVIDVNKEAAEIIEVEGVFVGIGVVSSTEFLHGVLDLDDDGFIKVDHNLGTSIPGVFAAGDVRVSPLRQILTAAADGALAGTRAAEYVAGEGWQRG